MTRIVVSLFVVVAAMVVSSPAKAGEVCNETSFMVEVAKAWRTATGLAVEGWVSIVPGGCAEVGPDADTEQYLYARSTRAYTGGVREWRGGLSVCVDETDFSFEGVADCEALGLEERQFRRLTEEERERATLVELDDFQDRAEEAGLQRLLRSAGYDIRVIDGYAGQRTRRQIAAFERDTEQDFNSDRTALLEALHQAALARNRNAGLQVCNEADEDIGAALARAVGDGFEARGWWRIAPGACAHLLSARITAGEVFVYARLMSDAGDEVLADASEPFCVAAGRFTTRERQNCGAIGFETVGFRPAPDPENGGSALVLTRDDFRELD